MKLSKKSDHRFYLYIPSYSSNNIRNNVLLSKILIPDVEKDHSIYLLLKCDNCDDLSLRQV